MFIFLFMIAALAFCFFIDAGIVWVICWGLNAIGIHSIGGWQVQFSWPLVIVVILISSLLGGAFRVTTTNK